MYVSLRKRVIPGGRGYKFIHQKLQNSYEIAQFEEKKRKALLYMYLKFFKRHQKSFTSVCSMNEGMNKRAF